MKKPFPSKVNSISRLRKWGFEASCVIDIGVNNSTQELLQVYPDKFHYLIEPVPFYNKNISEAYFHVKKEIYNIAVAKKSGRAAIQSYAVDGGGLPTHANIKKIEGLDLDSLKSCDEQTGPNRLFPVEVLTIDDFIEKNVIETSHLNNILLKIDVDGIEEEILSSLDLKSESVGILIIESSLQSFSTLVSLAESRGFVLFEVVDLCYLSGLLKQFDLIFVNKIKLNSIPEFAVSPDQIWEHWFQLSSIDPNPWH